MTLFEKYSTDKSLSKSEFQELSKLLENSKSKLEFEGKFNRDQKIVAFREMEEFVFEEGIGKLDSRKAFRISYLLFFRLFRNYVSIFKIILPESTLHIFKTEASFIWKAKTVCNEEEKNEFSNALSRINTWSNDELREVHLRLLSYSYPRNNINELPPISRLSNKPYLFHSKKTNDKEYDFHFFIQYSLVKNL